MKVVGIVAAGLLLARSGFAASERPMDVEDVLALSSVADPQISPDGRYVAYVVTERDEEENINDSDIWIVATEDGDPIRLTYHKGSDDSPLWAPDGSWLGFLSDRGEKKQVFGIRLAGRGGLAGNRLEDGRRVFPRFPRRCAHRLRRQVGEK